VRPTQTKLMWLAFAGAVAVVLAAMGWTTSAVLRLDAAEAESRRRAQLEENVRLALWRMDSALAPLIAAEHARPPGAFVDSGAARAAALLHALSNDSANKKFVKLYFQIRPNGVATSPNAGPQELAALGNVASLDTLLAALPDDDVPGPDVPPPVQPDAVADAQGVKGAKGQALRNAAEYQARAANQLQQQQAYVDNLQLQQAQAQVTGIYGGVMSPLWFGEELILARRVVGNYESAQGCWVDWTAVRNWLVNSVADLLPEAELLPLKPGTTDPDSRVLASLPVRLVPGELPAASERKPSPLRASLAVAWACVLLAVAAVAILLRGVVSLSERRGAFVSAVTHELRTPLTTLRMYTEMLADGMVEDEGRRQKYLSTLRAEADRLGHLVENVLAYSRLERNRAGYGVTTVKLGDVLGRALERLAERARHGGMELLVDVPDGVASTNVRTNPLALEQILFNLVDNACKYAASSADKRIGLSGRLSQDPPVVELQLRDHGPGISAAKAGSLFYPFSKTVYEAANSAPGLGLGLALSRRLARAMGGDLRVGSGVADGACFIVTVPLA
jgi:signal transduction histidine kinase